MNNARAQQRWQLVSHLRIYDNANKELVGHLFDVTTEGIRLISDQPIATDEEYQFYMDLPKDSSDAAACSLTARSVWSKEDVNPELFDTGFQLIDVSDETKSHLNSLIDQLKSLNT